MYAALLELSEALFSHESFQTTIFDVIPAQAGISARGGSASGGQPPLFLDPGSGPG